MGDADVPSHDSSDDDDDLDDDCRHSDEEFEQRRLLRALTRCSRALRASSQDEEARVKCAEKLRALMVALNERGEPGRGFGARVVAKCARARAGDACGRVAACVMSTFKLSVGFMAYCDGDGYERMVWDTIAVGLGHRLSTVRSVTVLAMGEAFDVGNVGNRRAFVAFLTGCDALSSSMSSSSSSSSLSANYFGALIRDRAASVRSNFTYVLGQCLADDDGVAPRVLPYILTALCDDIIDVREVAQEAVEDVIGTSKFEDLVGQNFGDVLEPALKELAAHAGTGLYEDITFQALQLIHTLVTFARERGVIQFAPNIYESMLAVMNHERTEERAKCEAKKTLDALERACPDIATVFSQLKVHH
jgi:hypothetical protein